MRIVFDIGGTHLRFAKYTENVLLESGSDKTPNYLQGLTRDEINQALVGFVCKAIGEHNNEISSVGICFAGPVSANGCVLGAPSIYGEKLEAPYDLRQAVIDQSGISSVWVINDLSAAAYRYIKDYNSFELITVSSSVGNKIVLDRQLMLGAEGFEGELGHVTAAFCAEVEIACPCGFGTNHLGVISSGRGIEAVAEQLKKGRLKGQFDASPLSKLANVSATNISLACEQNDMFAQDVIDFCTYPLAYAICLTLSSLYLEKIILMGGVIMNSPAYYNFLIKNILKIGVYNYSREHLLQKITKGIADDKTGLVGMNRYLQQKAGVLPRANFS